MTTLADSLDLDLVIARLMAMNPAVLKGAGGAVDFMAAQDGVLGKTPRAFVLAASESAKSNKVTLIVQQEVTFTFAVVYAISNVKDIRGKASQDLLRQVRVPCRQQLLGWTPDETVYAKIEFVRGALVRFQDQVLWWQDLFKTTYYIKGPSS